MAILMKTNRRITALFAPFASFGSDRNLSGLKLRTF